MVYHSKNRINLSISTLLGNLKKNGKLEESHFIGQVQPFSAIFDAARMRTKK